MSNDGKKIAFSFSKIKKPALVKKVDVDVKEKIDYVDCFDGSKGKFSYKGNVRNDENVKQELVIPMPSSKTSIEVLKSRIHASKNLDENSSDTDREKKSKENEIKSQSETQVPKNLDDLATIEILNEIKHGQVKDKEDSKLIIEAKDTSTEVSENDIDYDNIPVTEFGLALLRGMGWKPHEGIGKEPRIVEASSPNLRPKGLGLGAKLNNEINEDKKSHEDKKKVRKAK